MNEATIKTSMSTYVIMSLILSLPVLILPLVMLFQGTYISSNYWQGHLAIIAMMVWLFIYLYQEVTISGNSISLTKYTKLHASTKTIEYSSITSWNPINPLRLYHHNEEVMRIMWTPFRKSDQELIINHFLSLGIPQNDK